MIILPSYDDGNDDDDDEYSGTMVSSTIVDPVKPDLSVLRLELLVVLEVSPLAQVRWRSVLVEVQVDSAP